MKRYCKRRDILLDYEDFLGCDICFFQNNDIFCETLSIITSKYKLDEESHNNLVRQYLRKRKLERLYGN
jgi:hypothetical protein